MSAAPKADDTAKEIDRLLREYAKAEAEDKWREDERLNNQALMLQYVDYFVRTYGDDKRIHRMRAIWLELAPKVSDGLKIYFDERRWRDELARLEQAKDVPRPYRADVAYGVLNARARWLALEPITPARLEEFLVLAERTMLEHKQDPRSAQTAMMVGQLTMRLDEARALRSYEFASKSPYPEIAADADFAKAVLPYYHRPLDIEFTAVDGRRVSLAALRGKIVVIDFWATWCGPCIRELPALQQLYRDLHDRGLEVIGVSLDENRSKLLRFVQEKGIEWPHYFDGLGWSTKLSRRFGITSIPAVFIVGRDGRLVTAEGRDNLRATVTQLLAESGK